MEIHAVQLLCTLLIFYFYHSLCLQLSFYISNEILYPFLLICPKSLQLE